MILSQTSLALIGPLQAEDPLFAFTHRPAATNQATVATSSHHCAGSIDEAGQPASAQTAHARYRMRLS